MAAHRGPRARRCERTLPALLGMLGTIFLTTAAAAQSLEERTNQGLIEITAGNTSGVGLRMAEDLASVLNSPGLRRVVPVDGEGSLQNLTDLIALHGVDIAFVQLDVLDYARAHKLLPQIASLSYVARLWQAEFHLLAGSDIAAISDLAGKKVNVGGFEAGGDITGSRIFERLQMKIDATRYDPPTALEKLRAREIAAMVYVGGKPAPLFSGLAAKDGLKFLDIPLPCDFAGCAEARLTKYDYPDLVDQPVATLSVPIVMLAAPLARDSERYRKVAGFADAFFTRFPDLLDPPHLAKWHEVDLAAELPGWRRFGPAEAWLRQNSTVAVTPDERQLREIFERFLDERSKIAGGLPLTREQKDQLFEQFIEWQRSQIQTGSSVAH